MWISGPAEWQQAVSSAARAVTVDFALEGLTIRAVDGAVLDRWPFGQIVVGRGTDPLVLTGGARTGASW